MTDGPATIQAFHDQANLPNFKTHWKQIITENALVPIRFRLNGMKAVLGYTQPECSTWPVIRGATLSIRQIAKDLTSCFSQATRTSNTTYDCNEKIKAYKFAYDFADAYVEEASITRFEEIISLYYPDRTDLTAERENEIYKAFYKKLPAGNALGMKFLEATKTSIKKTKRDTIQDMYMRLSDHLNASTTQRSWGTADTAGPLQTAQLPRKQKDNEARCLMHHTPPTRTQWDSIQRRTHARHHTRRSQSVSQRYHITPALTATPSCATPVDAADTTVTIAAST